MMMHDDAAAAAAAADDDDDASPSSPLLTPYSHTCNGALGPTLVACLPSSYI